MPTRQGGLAREPATRQGGEPPEACSGDETEDEAPYLHPDPPTKKVDSPARAENNTDQPPRTRGRLDASSRQPWGSATSCSAPRSTGHHRRHLGSPRSTERHPQSSRDRGAHAGPLYLACAAPRAQRVPDDAKQTIARGRPFDEDIEQQAKTAAPVIDNLYGRRRVAHGEIALGTRRGIIRRRR